MHALPTDLPPNPATCTPQGLCQRPADVSDADADADTHTVNRHAAPPARTNGSDAGARPPGGLTEPLLAFVWADLLQRRTVRARLEPGIALRATSRFD